MRGFAPDDTSEDDDGVESVVLGHLLGSVNKLEAARDRLDVDVLGKRPVLLKCLDGTVEQGIGNLRIPFGYDDAEAHIACIGNTLCVVVGQMMKFCCHDCLVGSPLDILVNILVNWRVDVGLLDFLVDFECIRLFALTLQKDACLAQCQRCNTEVDVVGGFGISHLGSLLETVDGLVVLVVVGIDVAECHL